MAYFVCEKCGELRSTDMVFGGLFTSLVCKACMGSEAEGVKHDTEKLDWSVLPLEILEPLVAVFKAGEKKYGFKNWAKEFDNPDRRFFAAGMRHAKDCQDDATAIDPETGCYHSAQAAWNFLMRLHHGKEKSHD